MPDSGTHVNDDGTEPEWKDTGQGTTSITHSDPHHTDPTWEDPGQSSTESDPIVARVLDSWGGPRS